MGIDSRSQNPLNHVSVDLKYAGKCPQAFASLSQPPHILFILWRKSTKLCGSCPHVLKPFLIAATAPFVFSVRSIVYLRSEKKMIRVHARRVIALMKYAQAIWNSPVPQLPRNTVSENLRSGASGTDQAMSKGCGVGYPQPARTGFSDLRPEPFFKTSSLCTHYPY